MTPLTIEGTERTPAVVFNFESAELRISGEIYPEDVATFYGPVMTSLEDFLGDHEGPLKFEFELIYFNSSSAKIIMTLMEMLDEVAENGSDVDVYWFYDEEDDTMEELGEEFGEDLEHAKFHLQTMKG